MIKLKKYSIYFMGVLLILFLLAVFWMRQVKAPEAESWMTPDTGFRVQEKPATIIPAIIINNEQVDETGL